MGFVQAFEIPKIPKEHIANAAPGRMIRGFAAHPFGASTALPYCSSARCAAVEPDSLIVSQVRMGSDPALRILRTQNKHPNIGAPGRIRTCDTRLRRPVLYPAELRARRSQCMTEAGVRHPWMSSRRPRPAATRERREPARASSAACAQCLPLDQPRWCSTWHAVVGHGGCWQTDPPDRRRCAARPET